MVEGWDQDDAVERPTTSFEVELDDDAAGSDIPAPVLEALVDAAWGLRGLRVAFARLEGTSLQILAAAGPERPFDPALRAVELQDLPRLRTTLLSNREPVAIEDIEHDSLTRSAPGAWGTTRAVLMVPIPGSHAHGSPMVALVESARPRTWGKSEHLALERLLPLLAMAADNLDLRWRHRALEDDLRTLERQSSASQALGSIVTEELRRTLSAMERPTADTPLLLAHARTLLEALSSSFGPRVGERICEPLDLQAVLFALLPRVRALLGPHGAIAVARCAEPMPALHAFRPGVERLVTHLLLLLSQRAPEGDIASIQLALAPRGSELALTVHGNVQPADALDPTDREQERDREQELSQWLVRMELALHGATWVLAPDERLCDTASAGVLFPLR